MPRGAPLWSLLSHARPFSSILGLPPCSFQSIETSLNQILYTDEWSVGNEKTGKGAREILPLRSEKQLSGGFVESEKADSALG